MYELLYGRPCHSSLCLNETGDNHLLGLEIITKTTKKICLIRERLHLAQSQQKSYVDTWQNPLEFQANDQVFLQVSPRKGILPFGKKGNLSRRYIGSFKII